MSNPTTPVVTPNAMTVFLGQTVDFQAVASDPDAQVLAGQVIARDKEGNPSLPATIQITISDPITYEVTLTPEGVGTLIQDPNTPGLFHYSAPTA